MKAAVKPGAARAWRGLKPWKRMDTAGLSWFHGPMGITLPLLAIVGGLLVGAGHAKSVAPVRIEKLADTSAITRLLGKGKLVAVGKEWDARRYCNEETLANPDQLEAFSLKGRDYELVVLCAGTLDGEENVVSVFSGARPPRTRRVAPLESSSRISDEALKATLREMLR